MPSGIYKRVKPVTEETRKKKSLAMMGKKLSEEAKLKISKANKGKVGNNLGKKFSDEHKKRIGLANSKPKPYFIGEKHPQWKGGFSSCKTCNKKLTIRNSETGLCRSCLAKTKKGENNRNWKGGISPINNIIRQSIEAKLWIQSVFARDGYTCQKTGIKGCKLTAHHILNFSSHPEIRFAIDNGITLSIESHIQFHKIYGKKNNTREQLEEFLKS